MNIINSWSVAAWVLTAWKRISRFKAERGGPSDNKYPGDAINFSKSYSSDCKFASCESIRSRVWYGARLPLYHPMRGSLKSHHTRLSGMLIKTSIGAFKHHCMLWQRLFQCFLSLYPLLHRHRGHIWHHLSNCILLCNVTKTLTASFDEIHIIKIAN